MCGCKTLVFLGHNRKRIKALDIDNLCSLVRFWRLHRVKNEDVRLFDVKKSLEIQG